MGHGEVGANRALDGFLLSQHLGPAAEGKRSGLREMARTAVGRDDLQVQAPLRGPARRYGEIAGAVLDSPRAASAPISSASRSSAASVLMPIPFAWVVACTRLWDCWMT
jgi:hypothetical protein